MQVKFYRKETRKWQKKERESQRPTFQPALEQKAEGRIAATAETRLK